VLEEEDNRALCVYVCLTQFGLWWQWSLGIMTSSQEDLSCMQLGKVFLLMKYRRRDTLYDPEDPLSPPCAVDGQHILMCLFHHDRIWRKVHEAETGSVSFVMRKCASFCPVAWIVFDLSRIQGCTRYTVRAYKGIDSHKSIIIGLCIDI
jgi:hypothetical protein